MGVDIQLGQELPVVVIDSVDPGSMKLVLALTRDPSPLHWDDDKVRKLGLGERPINPGSNNAAYVLRMVGSWIGDYGRIRKIRLRFLDRVYAGERLKTGGRVDRIVAGGEGVDLIDVAVWLDRMGAPEGGRVVEGEVQVVRPRTT